MSQAECDIKALKFRLKRMAGERDELLAYVQKLEDELRGCGMYGVEGFEKTFETPKWLRRSQSANHSHTHECYPDPHAWLRCRYCGKDLPTTWEKHT